MDIDIYRGNESLKLMRKIFLAAIAIFLFLAGFAQSAGTSGQEMPITLQIKEGKIKGTLLLPDSFKTGPVALIISGSGPTDRDGNNPQMKNNSLKLLAIELAKQHIATVRYDKRGIAESGDIKVEEKDMRFENFVSDVKDWIKLLKADKRFTKVIVIGHSEGSLLGIIASNTEKPAAFISVAGAGRRADFLIKDQLKNQPKEILDLVNPILDSLVKGKTVQNVDANLYTLFRPERQPYEISWFKYDPAKEIQRLTVPCLIVQGKNDLQVSTDDAIVLSRADKMAKLALIEKMNHILKDIDGDKSANMSSYGNPNLPISPEFVNAVCGFIKGL